MKKREAHTNTNQATGNQIRQVGQQVAAGVSLEVQEGWAVTKRVRLPHKAGLPLGSGSSSDGIER